MLVTIFLAACLDATDAIGVEDVLWKMQDAAARGALRGELVVAGTDGRPADCVRFWIDRQRRKIATEFRRPDAPLPRVKILAGSEGFELFHLRLGETLRVGQPLPELADLIARTRLSSMWHVALCGQLPAPLKLESYADPTLLSEQRTIAGERCHGIRYGGNQSVTLWVAESDWLPRKIESSAPVFLPPQTVTALVRERNGAGTWFQVDRSRFRAVDFSAVQQWGTEKARNRWPKAGTRTPEFRAVDRQERTRQLREYRGQPLWLVFSFAGPEDVVRNTEAIVDAIREQSPEIAIKLVWCPDDSGNPASIPLESSLSTELWFSEEAFLRFQIASCPVFFGIDSAGVVVGAGVDVEAVAPVRAQLH